MKWKGTVSQCEKITIAARLATEKTTQATSTQATRPWWKRARCGQRMRHGHGGGQVWAGCRGSGASRCELITLTAHRLDQLEAQLGPEPPDTYVHHVGAGVEVVAPDRRQQLALAHRLARVVHQFPQQQELQPGERHRAV